MSNLTKKALAQALKSKITEKDLSQITVTELTSICGIKRQTFYYHFNDIYDLLKWLYTNEIIKEIKIDDTYESWTKCYSYIFEYIKKNKDLILRTYNSIAKDYFQNFLNRHTKTFISKVIEEKTSDIAVDSKTKNFLSNYYKNVLIGFIKDWIEEGMLEDTSSLITKVECILEGSIDLYFSNLNKLNK